MHGKGIQAVLALLRSLACVNVYDVYGQNALENHIANHAYVNKELAMLLFAAGEKIDGTCAFQFDKAGHLVCSVPVPRYLLEHEGDICLMQMCRKVIRQYIIAINPNQHLFHRVPQIGLPTMLSDYLLYDLSIDDEDYDPEKGDDSNDSNGEDEHYSEETEEDEAEDDTDTMDTSEDSSDSDETESDD